MIVSGDRQRRLSGAGAAEQEAEGFLLPLRQRWQRVAEPQRGAGFRSEQRAELS